MTWKQRHALRTFWKSALWPIPLAFMIVAPLCAHAVLDIDQRLGWTMGLSADGARAVASILTGSMLTLIVFIFTVVLLAVQVASAQFTPRVIARVFQDPGTKIALGLFVFVLTFSLVVLGRLEDPVPKLAGLSCAYGALTCVAVFVFLIDRLGKELRPVRILTGVATEGRDVIRTIYPKLEADTDPSSQPPDPPAMGKLTETILHSGGPGVLLAFDDRGLLELARDADCVIELVPQVGDFIPPDDPLFRIYGNRGSIDRHRLAQSVAIGPERTVEQDPAFSFRIIVDIASKALSPAINDPTTAVLAIDQIHHLLGQVGIRQLDTGQDCDEKGQLRLVYRTPDWEDFVQLAVTEIRHFGGESIQVARRLRAMLQTLMQTLPESRARLLRRELDLLHRSSQRFFTEPEDLALAEIGDNQGVGGTHDNRRMVVS
ncbi:MAG: DUF2254 domain-containing protein [Gemmataceae bacterium]